MNLFKLDNYELTIDPLAYSLEPFAKLIDRDPELGIAELKAVYFFADAKSDFASILDDEERLRQIKAFVRGLSPEWKPDTLVEQAIDFYKKLSETVTTKLYEAALIGISKMEKHLRTVNFSDVDKSGKPKYNAKQYNDLLMKLGDTMKSLKQLEDIIMREREAKGNLRGGRNKGFFED
jgi:hypothetical protein